MTELEVIEDIVTDKTDPCPLCARRFLPERLEKHQKICNKIKESEKKRKLFDSQKQRADLEQVNGYRITPPSRLTTANVEKKQTNNKTSNWRAKHEEFLRSVRQARGEKVDEPTNGVNPVPVGYIVCQFCGRNFSDKAADRHIEWCREQKARIPRSANNIKALERMKARVKYKPLNKLSPKTETPPQLTPRSQPPTPPINRKITTVKSSPKPSPPKSLPFKTSPKPTPKNRTIPLSPPTKGKSDKQRIYSLSRPKNSSPDSIEHLIRQTEPVMKFKEKFPNHRVDTNLLKNENLRELLKKTEAYNGGPRTVPGVRTGGMSPIKNENSLFNQQNRDYSNNNHISEDEELTKLKYRIEEMYLNGSTKFKPNSLQNKNNSKTLTNGTNNKNNIETNSESTTRGSTSGSSAESSSIHSIPTPPRDRDGSGSDGTRSQASSTTSTGIPKFCHQCGTKYPSTIAKYCYECGSRRLGTAGPFL